MSAASEIATNGAVLGIVGLALLAALTATRLSERVPVPPPLLFLVAGAAVADVSATARDALSIVEAERIATAAIIVILLDGGLHLGRTRLRPSLSPVLLLGLPGTFLVAGIVAVAAHGLFGLGWSSAALLGAALSPTDPAMVFSVLGRRQITGRSGTVLEGEAGANDPVGIALMLGVLAFVAEGGASAWAIGAEFAYAMVVGAIVGVVGGVAIVWLTRRVALPAAGMYPVRVLLAGFVVFGAAATVDASGFLAVFTAGIVVADAPVPFRSEIVRFHTALGSLAEVVVFTVLGLTVSLGELSDPGTWAISLGIAAILTVVARPVVALPLLVGSRLGRGERLFIAWAGLKGAVPILLASLAVIESAPDAERLYAIVFLVVASTVLVQGTTIQAVADRLRVPMRTLPAEPFGLEVRLAEEPTHVGRHVVAAGSGADGVAIRDVDVEGGWIALVVRDGAIVPPTGATVLRAGDAVVVVAQSEAGPLTGHVFRRPRGPRGA